MAHLHLDCFSGISGDMFLGALIDSGLSMSTLKQGLRHLPLHGYTLKAQKVLRSNIQATKVDVFVRKGFTKSLTFSAIRRLLRRSTLPPSVKQQSLEVFARLADAEGHIHGVEPEKVHFHEIGLMDSFVDIVGAFLGCHYLDVETVSSTPINLGSGTVQTAHGTLPIPPPVVARLAIGVPVFSSGPAMELTTPTGMGIVTQLTREFSEFPPVIPTSVGYGAGSADPAGWPNVLRIFHAYQRTDRPSPCSLEQIVQLETNLDDLNPQMYPTIVERLFGCGALDVSLTPVIMKRGRPGITITVLTPQTHVHHVLDVLFRESTTLGVRIQNVWRYVLPRETQTVRVRDGMVRIKVATLNGFRKAAPEYEDCQVIADRTGCPVQVIVKEALQNFNGRTSPGSQKRRTPRSSATKPQPS